MSPPEFAPSPLSIHRTFPGEITDMIIDLLHSDSAETLRERADSGDLNQVGQSLGKLGLVHSSWLKRSRFNLFSHVELTNHNIVGFFQLLGVFDNCVVGTERDTLAAMRRQHLEGHVKSLTISVARLTLYDESDDEDAGLNEEEDSVTQIDVSGGVKQPRPEDTQPVESSSLHELLNVLDDLDAHDATPKNKIQQIFSSVHTLWLDFFSAQPVSAFHTLLQTQFQHLMTLRLVGLQLDTFSDLVRLLGYFPQVEWLTISGEWLSFDDADSSSHPILSHLRGLFLCLEHNHPPLQRLVDWLVYLTPPPPISLLHWKSAHAFELGAMSTFLDHLGPRLEHFRISPSLEGDLCAEDGDDKIQASSLFRLNTRLESIHLEPDGNNLTNAEALKLFYALLQKIVVSSREMRRVSLEYVVKNTGDPSTDDTFTNPTWTSIDRLLDTRSKFPHLEAVEVFLTAFGGGGDVVSETVRPSVGAAVIPVNVHEKFRKKSLPRCAARGLVKIYDNRHPRTWKIHGNL